MLQRILSLLGAILTFILTVAFSSLNCLQTTVHETVEVFKTQIEANVVWDKEVANIENETTHRLRMENKSISNPALEEACVSVIVDQTARYFNTHYPFFSGFIDSRTKIPVKLGVGLEFFKGNPFLIGIENQSLCQHRAIDAAASSMGDNIEENIAEFAAQWRFRLALIFVLCQMVTFCPISIAAYKDLKVIT